MSPEHWNDPTKAGPASDIYSLGVIAYEALTGRRPFAAETTNEYGELHCHAAVPPLGGNFSPALDRFFQRALAKRPEERWGSALEMTRALRAALRSQTREQLRISAQQWQDRDRPRSLLWRGGELADLERWTRRSTTVALGEPEVEFVEASRRHARRVAWTRRLIVALAAVLVFGAFQYRAALETRMAQQVAEISITQAAVEQGRQALLHDASAEAQLHLGEAYRRGNHSPGVMFMLARALQPRLAERARLASSSGRMWSAAFSPDGRQIVTTDDRAAQLWDVETHQRLFALPHGDTVYHALYSADSTRLATAGGDGIVKLWEAATGTLVRELTARRADGKPSRYFVMAASRDGRFIAAMDMMGEVAHVWDATVGALLAELPGDETEFPSLAFSADGRWLAASGGDDVRVFDTSTWTRALTIAGPRIRSLSFDPTGPRLATGTASGAAAIWGIPSGERIRHLREMGEPIDAVAFSPNGELIVTASRDGTEQVWNAGSGLLQSHGNYLRSKVWSVEFDSSSKLVVSAGANGRVAVTDAMLGMPVAVLEGSKNATRVAHFDPSSHRVVSASWDGTARVWDATAPYRRWSAPAITDDCGLLSGAEPDQRFLAIGCRGNSTRVWDTSRDSLLAELPPVTQPDGDFAAVFPAVTHAGDRAAIARGNTVGVYELPGGRLLRTIAHGAAVSAVVFAHAGHDVVSGAVDGSVLVTRDGFDPIALPPCVGGIDAVTFLMDQRVLVVDAQRRLRVYDSDDKAIVAELETPTRVRSLRLSPDGRNLITIPSYTGKAAPPVLWDVEHYGIVAHLDGHVGRVFSARFVAGDAILTAGNDGSARLWDSNGRHRQTYRGSSRFLADAVLDPEGAMVVAGSGDGSLRFWDAEDGRPLWTLQAHKSHVVGIHFEGDSIVTRGFAGDVSRWTLPNPAAVVEACSAGKVALAENDACIMMPR